MSIAIAKKSMDPSITFQHEAKSSATFRALGKAERRCVLFLLQFSHLAAVMLRSLSAATD
jgi:hypothetical protein